MWYVLTVCMCRSVPYAVVRWLENPHHHYAGRRSLTDKVSREHEEDSMICMK
jgi:hypothetical protein